MRQETISDLSSVHTQPLKRVRDVAPFVKLLQVPFEPCHEKTNKLTCAPSKDSDQPGHPPSLIRIFAVRSMAR